MTSGGVTQDALSKSKFYPCRVCNFRVKANSVLCAQCGKRIHKRCAGVTPRFSRNLLARNVN